MSLLRIGLLGVVAGACLIAGVWFYFEHVANPRVIGELRTDPGGDTAAKVMLLTLPSGREIPANFWREGDAVYAGADGRWWKELVGDGVPVGVLIQGERRSGTARAVRDDPAYRDRIFAKLRPKALPGFGTLIEIRLDDPPR
ncbi:MAG: hypothetical protein HKP30_03680 [Myxococcales bacterium]|nr:hypothetical protein [Myxococcales bacterium]